MAETAAALPLAVVPTEVLVLAAATDVVLAAFVVAVAVLLVALLAEVLLLVLALAVVGAALVVDVVEPAAPAATDAEDAGVLAATALVVDAIVAGWLAVAAVVTTAPGAEAPPDALAPQPLRSKARPNRSTRSQDARPTGRTAARGGFWIEDTRIGPSLI